MLLLNSVHRQVSVLFHSFLPGSRHLHANVAFGLMLLLGAVGMLPLDAVAEKYSLGPRDVVRVTVYGQPDLETVSRIGERGTISFPVLGEVRIGGLSEQEAAAVITQRLKQSGVVASPQVNVTVEEFQSQLVSILGEVDKPGEYPIERRTTLLELISKAGGLRPEAGDTAVVTRSSQKGSGRQEIDLANLFGKGGGASNVEVTGGDIVYIATAPVVYVYGQVNRPGAYKLERNMIVMQAISVAGGLTDKATERGLTITRTRPSGGTSTVAGSMMERLQPNDIVQVKESLF